jgi:predicted PurR-regulated permease PerM
LQALGWVLLGLITLIVIDRSRHVLELVLVAVVLAMLLRGPIEALSRNVPRWAAITVVVLGTIAVVAGLLALGTIQLRQEVDAVGESVTQRIEDVDPDSAIGEFLVEARVAERIDEHLDRLPTQVIIGSPDPADGARLGLEALLVIVLALYGLANGPRLLRPLLSADRSTIRWARYVNDGIAAGASQVRRLLTLATLSGLVGLATAMAFDLPGTSVLALWTGVWATVPIFGPIVGYAPLVVLASLEGRPQAAVVIAVAGLIAVASWYADRHVYTRRVGAAGVRVGPFGLTVALVIGLRFGWLTGPLVAIFLMTVVVSTLAAYARRPIPAALDDAEASADSDADADAATAASTHEANDDRSRRFVWGRLEPRSALRATAIVVIVVAGLALILDLSPVPVWILIGVTLSIALDPLVEWVERRTPLGRGSSIAVVVVGLLAVVTATLLLAVPSVAQSVRDLDDQLPRIAADLERLPLVGDELAERGIAERLQTTLEEAPDRLASDTGPLEGALRSVGDGLVATFWILLITVTALIDGRRARLGLRSLAAADRQSRFDRVDSIVGRVVARYAVGSVVIAAIAGTAAFTIAFVADVPLAPLLGLWAALTNFIPQIGGYLGAAPLVVLGLTTGTTKGLVVLVVYLTYMQIENRVIQPIIVSKAVDIPPFVAMVAVLVGSAVAGVVGAVLVTPIVAVAKTLYTEFRQAQPDGDPDVAG